MSLALGVAEMCANKNGKVKIIRGGVMKFDRTNTIDLPLVPNDRTLGTKKTVQKEEGPELI